MAMSRLPDIGGDKPAKKRFKANPIGTFILISPKCVPRKQAAPVRRPPGRRLPLSNPSADRTSKFAFARLEENANRVTATALLEALIEIVPYKIHTVLTDNGVEFCYQHSRRNGPTARTIRQLFDMRCQENGIEYRLTKPNHPWNGEDQKTVWE